MTKCWEYFPAKRPNFSEIHDSFLHELETNSPQLLSEYKQNVQYLIENERTNGIDDVATASM